MAPDLDTMLYNLSGMADAQSGWEPTGETYACFDVLRRLGGPERIPVGDRSLALPLLRSEALRNDRRPTEIALDFCRRLGISAASCHERRPGAHPAHHEAGEVRYHEYFENLSGEPAVRGFSYAGAADANLSDEVLDALYAKDLEASSSAPPTPSTASVPYWKCRACANCCARAACHHRRVAHRGRQRHQGLGGENDG